MFTVCHTGTSLIAGMQLYGNSNTTFFRIKFYFNIFQFNFVSKVEVNFKINISEIFCNILLSPAY